MREGERINSLTALVVRKGGKGNLETLTGTSGPVGEVRLPIEFLTQKPNIVEDFKDELKLQRGTDWHLLICVADQYSLVYMYVFLLCIFVGNVIIMTTHQEGFYFVTHLVVCRVRRYYLARYARTEKSVKDLNLSVDLLKKESAKLLQRTALAEKEMKYGHTELQYVLLVKERMCHFITAEYARSSLISINVYIGALEANFNNWQNQHTRLKPVLLVASMASNLKRQRSALNKRIVKINELGVPV
ncbi:hypothetical protein V8G54_000851 [Vigna mungo]|uniref:Uncharacterized protein n=1 Tax=Vigna mungo TaxID=3915 RepID=A0AAQ3S9C1_VIGMU